MMNVATFIVIPGSFRSAALHDGLGLSGSRTGIMNVASLIYLPCLARNRS